MADDRYSCEVIQDDGFSLEDAGRFPPPVPPQTEKEVEKLPEYIPSNNSTESGPKESRKEPKEMKGTVLKKKGVDNWKDRYMHVRPKVRALFYYEKLAKAQKNCKPLGVYPLLGTTVSDVQKQADETFTFSLLLRTGQSVGFKLLDRREAREWRSALHDTAQLPCSAPLEGVTKGECTLKQTLMNAKRTIILDFSSGYFYACKKNDELTVLEQHPLKNSTIIPQKSFDATFDVIIHSDKDYRKEYSFKNPEEWAKWCAELEAVVLREKQHKRNAQ